MSGLVNKIKAWWQPPDDKYGVPSPLFCVPLAIVNKQVNEFPQGHFIPPCLLPPPEVTFVDGVLTINGTSVSIPTGGAAAPEADLSIILAGLYSVGETTDYRTTFPANNPDNYILQVRVDNVGSVAVPNAKIIVSQPSLVDTSGTYYVTYSGGATGPATVSGTQLINSLVGLAITNMPAGSSVLLSGAPTVYGVAVAIVNTGVRVMTGTMVDKNPQDNYVTFAVNVTAPV